jgi:hypothetical protein
MTRSFWKTFLRTMVGRAYPRLIGVWREKSWIIFDVLFPLLQVSAYVYIYRAVGAPPEFAGFAVLGGAMIAYWMNVLWSMASQLYWEKETGNLQLYLIAPTSRMAILLGMALGGLTATTVRAAGVLLVGTLLFHVPLQVTDGALFFGVFVLTMVALYGLGMLLSSVFLLWGREAWPASLTFSRNRFFFSPAFTFPCGLWDFGWLPPLPSSPSPWASMPCASSSTRALWKSSVSFRWRRSLLSSLGFPSSFFSWPGWDCASLRTSPERREGLRSGDNEEASRSLARVQGGNMAWLADRVQLD